MNLTEYMSSLAQGKLYNTSLSDEGNVRAGTEDRYVYLINEGLTRLHSRFFLRENAMMILLYDHITTYELSSKYSLTLNPPVAPGQVSFILDTVAQPFVDDVLKVMHVYKHSGEELPLNDRNQSHSCFTPRNNVLIVNSPVEGSILSILYQAKHPRVSLDDSGTNDIQIPDQLVGALDAYVAHSQYNSIGSQDSSYRANEQYQMYENICSEFLLTDSGGISNSTTNQVFQKNGWI